MRKLAATLTASALVVGSIAGYEGYRTHAYQDVVGVWTIGYGITGGVKRGDQTDPVRAVQALTRTIDEKAREAAKCIADVPLHQYEFDAYVSFAYNVGTPAFCGSTLVRKLKATPPDYAGACREVLRWVYAGDQQPAGLARRRAEEYRRCMGAAQ